MKELKLAMLGFGNAGKAFAKMLTDKQKEINEKYGTIVKVVAITTNSRGCIIDENGIDLVKACNDVETTGKFGQDTSGLTSVTSFEVIENVNYDVLIELTPLEIFTGQPAINHIKGAFSRGKNVITANKGPIAWAFNELKDMAEKQNCLFFYETTVMDGTPIFNLVEHTLKFCKVTEVSGILNSTTNYILEELAMGKEYDDVIVAGKKLGFIEANPAMDIEGYDAAAKVTALLNVLMDAGITPNDVDRTGIENITVDDIKAAATRGNVIKLICKGTLESGKVVATVKPMEISKSDLLASIDGTSSVVAITTDLMGKLSIVEHGPEIEQTAYGVFGDTIRILDELKNR